MKLENMIRRSALVKSGVPRGSIDRFEKEHPESFSKINPLTRNSPMLVDEKAFRAWWESCRRAAVQGKRTGVM